MMKRTLRLSGTAGAEHAGSFIYLPFYVPERARTLEVQYSYCGLGPGECVVDIGLFEPGPLDLSEAMSSFREWSGSSKRSFYVSKKSATPGYLPGPLRAGVWHVVLGFYRASASGCSYEVEVHVSDEARGETRQLPETSEARERRGWVKGDFHVHSIHSDGNSSIEEIALEASRLELDFVAVTDHNTHSHTVELGGRDRAYGKLVVGGVELTTYKGAPQRIQRPFNA